MKNLFILTFTFAVMMFTACSSSSTQEATSTVDSTAIVNATVDTTVTTIDSVSTDTTK